jgi:glycine cleavage system H protein
MKEIDELNFPEDVRYTKDHEWTRKIDGAKTRVGISDYAQDQLGDIVFAEVPEVGASFKKGDEFGTLESVKAVAPVFMPISGKVLAVNTALEESPGLVNEAPYTDGWLIEVEASDPAELDELLDRNAYFEFLRGLEQ